MTPFIKDLRILNRDLSQVVIVDNSVYAFWFQIDNGIPILPFEGVQDRELEVLEMYLNRIANVDDVRPINRRMFQVHLYSQFSDVTSLLKAYV